MIRERRRTRHINLERELRRLCLRNRDGSFATQANRRDVLRLCARQLKALGIYHLAPQGLKPKHIEMLVKHWLSEGKSAGTIKNRMCALRWWAEKVGKQNVVARDNAVYGIPMRRFVTNQSKAKDIPDAILAKVPDERIRCALALQRAFGLRREECLKFQPKYADKGDSLQLKASWTKGGKARCILLRTLKQREVLQWAHRVAGSGSMIPPEKSYVEQMRRYEGMTKYVGLSKMHGLRHAYAQERYQELTGRLCPACGGKTSRELSSDEKTRDRRARLQISQELGHEREEVTAVYLGR